MSEPIGHVSAEQAHRALNSLRRVIIGEYIAKLPKQLSVRQTGYLLQASDHEILKLIFRGEIIARRSKDGIVIVPADNADLLMTTPLLRLPLPEPADLSDPVWVELALTRRACKELNRRAAHHQVTPSELVEGMLGRD
ncbi:hypothetical protein [Diaminobutyricibacter sp. McL0608]|uniref:hypothetical protein n=1 Tax=Leifsonia sp. McL0608 TaxID=3143537 RepID=UPI0031F30B9D